MDFLFVTVPCLLDSILCERRNPKSDAVCFYNAAESYHVYLMPVPFLAADVFCEVSSSMDGGKREFQWIPHDIFQAGPLSARIQSRALFAQLTGVEVQKIVQGWSQILDRERPNTFEVMK
ncbi:unnamed protein product [Amoebophrya sp. A120]|nr:unnamed protein product [Amoebophrya sp. A120]|eukprot:GSA120T00015375001.1